MHSTPKDIHPEIIVADKVYCSDQTANYLNLTKDTLARWRMERRGIPFIKAGSKVLYRGQDLLDWLENNRIDVTK